MLVRLLYASRTADAVTHEVIESILAQSRKHNPELGITGILCHG
ncbi:MAG: BLUF domain-containing protein, partial [Pseudomonadota bacterium]